MRFLLIASICTNIAVLLWVLYSGISSDVELANKPEWSALQTAEARHKMQPKNKILIIRADGKDEKYDLIGIGSPEGDYRIWVMASPSIAPKIKTMPPDAKVRLSASDYENIKATIKLNEETEIFLKNAVGD